MGQGLGRSLAISRITLGLTTILLSAIAGAPSPTAVQAGTCAAPCSRPEIAPNVQFTPGQTVRVEILNRTSFPLQVEQVLRIQPRFIQSGELIELALDQGTAPNASVAIWEETETTRLRFVLSRRSQDLLRVDVYQGGPYPGDRAVYILDDGRVQIQ